MITTDSQLKRHVGFWGLLWTSVGSIIGSGWLFGALVAATVAGPSALIGWVLASGIVILLALVHAELAGLFPVSGGTSRFPHYAFGNFAGMTFGWASYLQAAATAPIEVLAAIQYMSTTSWGHGLYNASGTLTHQGMLVATGLMLCFVILNLIGIRWLSRANSAITVWKVLIPVGTVVVLLATHFHPGNFTAGGGFFVHDGGAIHAILVSLPTGGIVFALLGFEQATQLGGEAKNPGRDLPRAVITSILIGAALYTLLQFAFIGSLDPKLLVEHTWTGLGAGSTDPAVVALNAGPFYAIASVAGLAWIAFILRLDAVVSPFGSGLIYLTTSSRISHAMARNGSIPEQFERTSRRTLVPVFGVLFSTAIGLLFLLPFPSWSKLVGIVTSASVLMYASAPLALGALRKSKPDLPRVYRLPAAGVLAPLAFVCATWIMYWSGWQTLTTLMAAMLVGYALIAFSYAFKLNPAATKVEWRAALWIGPYLLGMLVISYFGGFGAGGIIGGVGPFNDVLADGGNNALGLVGGLVASAAWSLVVYRLAVALRLPEEAVDRAVEGVDPGPAGEEAPPVPERVLVTSPA
ncbi:APC family permease [Solirubrobacter phytolaccae]|uniref:APC family permease n=1 Tax=Solirubrobacter phytolaccae TaxID=1404360 RepID=A0A9X3N7S1_9ACTN|nr:APC family permease [Solirubrobacter phytolaccae]MDA0180030.1 APC family permease [Solirubrobacter phytolaccae]